MNTGLNLLRYISRPHRPNNTINKEIIFDLNFEIYRLFTFPVNKTLLAKQLAASGFFLTDSKSFIQCIRCAKKMPTFPTITADVLENGHKKNCAMLINLNQDNDNVPIPASTDYCNEGFRLHTFYGITWIAPVSPYDLAKDGFYWDGSIDSCRCTFCRLEISSWEPEDTARGEHQRLNPNCPFLQGRDCGNVEIGNENFTTAINNLFTTNNATQIIREKLKFADDNAKEKPLIDLGIHMIAEPRYPHYSIQSARLRTYFGWDWQNINTPKKEDLANAGFYYTGVGDKVICFQCGGGLNDWSENDNPWFEHAKWFSNCQYLLLKKDKKFVDYFRPDNKVGIFDNAGAQSKHAVVELEGPNKVSEDASGIVTFLSPSSGPFEEFTCRICRKEKINTVNLPCAHMEYCLRCTGLTKICEKCEAKVDAFVEVHQC